jgi:hypothetical protein
MHAHIITSGEQAWGRNEIGTQTIALLQRENDQEMVDEAATDGGPSGGPPNNPLFPSGTGKHLRLINQPMMNGIQRQFEAVGDTELVEDVMQMVLDGLFGDEELFADFLVAEALRDELHDFFLAVAKQWLFAARAGLAGFGKRFHDLGGHAVVEPDFTGMHAMNTFHEEISGGLLQDDTARAEAHGANNVAIVFRGGQDDDARGQCIEIDFLKNGQAVFIRHAQIEEKNVGLELGEELDALRAVLGFTDDGDVFVGIEKLPQAIAKDRVVIG